MEKERLTNILKNQKKKKLKNGKGRKISRKT